MRQRLSALILLPGLALQLVLTLGPDEVCKQGRLETWELIGGGSLLALAKWPEFMLVGRLFRASLLASGQRPALT